MVNARRGCLAVYMGSGGVGTGVGPLRVPEGTVTDVFHAGFLAVYLSDPSLVPPCSSISISFLPSSYSLLFIGEL